MQISITLTTVVSFSLSVTISTEQLMVADGSCDEKVLRSKHHVISPSTISIPSQRKRRQLTPEELEQRRKKVYIYICMYPCIRTYVYACLHARFEACFKLSTITVGILSSTKTFTPGRTQKVFE